MIKEILVISKVSGLSLTNQTASKNKSLSYSFKVSLIKAI